MNNEQRLSNDKLLEVLSYSKNATAVYTTEKIIIEAANDAMLAFWGKDRSIIGKPLHEAVPELNGQPFITMLRNVLATGVTDAGQAIPATTLIDGQLQTNYYDYEYRAIQDATGKTYAILHTASNVTERVLSRQALAQAKEQEEALLREQAINEEMATLNEELTASNEELLVAQRSLQNLNDKLEERVIARTKALAESEARLRYMLAEAPVAIALMTGPEHIIEAANKKVLEVWGKTGDVIGMPLKEAVPELVGQVFLNVLDDVYTSGEPFYGSEVKALLEQNGVIEEVYSNFVYYPLKDENDRTISTVLVANVITELVLSRKKAEEAEENLRLAVESANLGTFSLNLITGQLNFSQRSRELYGFPSDGYLTSEDVVKTVDTEYKKLVQETFSNAPQQQQSCDIQYTIQHQLSGEPKWIRLTGKTYFEQDGKATRFLGVMIDITERKKDEQRKNDFIGMVSHELKTPLTSLSAYIQILQASARQSIDNHTTVTLSKSFNQVKRMTTLINGFLNVSRLESGKIQVDKTDFLLDDLVKEIIDDAAIVQPVYKVTFLPCKPVVVNADRDKVGNVVSNLLNNAMKYSPDNKNIEVSCDIIGNTAQVSIKDEGIGIRPEDTKKLFERYYRVGGNQNISGFGIGLYLSAEIVQRHGGTIWVESEVGKGSRFYFTLPL